MYKLVLVGRGPRDIHVTCTFILNYRPRSCGRVVYFNTIDSTNIRIRTGRNGEATAPRRWRRLSAYEELVGNEVNGVDGDSEAVESCWAFGFPNTVSIRNQLDDLCVCGSHWKPWALCCLHFHLCHWNLLFRFYGRFPFLSPSLFFFLSAPIPVWLPRNDGKGKKRRVFDSHFFIIILLFLSLNHENLESEF